MLHSANQNAASAQTDTASARLYSNDQPAFAPTELIHCCYNVDTGFIDFLCIVDRREVGEERKGKEEETQNTAGGECLFSMSEST